MEYVLFVLVTATLFLRPAELVPALIGLPIYNYLILSCLIVSSPKIIENLQPQRLRRQPITVTVLAMIVAVAMSHFSRLDLWSTRTYTTDYIKTVLYYVLLLSVVDTESRLRAFFYWIAVFTVLLSCFSIGHFVGIVEIPALESLQDWDYDSETGERVRITRLRGTGIFNDPNDLSSIVVVGMVFCAMGIFDLKWRVFRFAWAIPLVFLGYVLMLTQSRGGFLAMVVSVASLFCSRYGIKKSIVLVALLIPVVIGVFGGRQTDLAGAMTGGTGESRIELWSQGLQMLRANPVFGVGFRQYASHAGLVAHNSFVHCYAELGFLGGTVFFSCFWFTGRVLWEVNTRRRVFEMLTGSRQLSAMCPFVMAALAGFVVSLMSLSRAYTATTYLMLGIVAAYQSNLALAGWRLRVGINAAEIARIIVASVGFIVVVYLYIKLGFR